MGTNADNAISLSMSKSPSLKMNTLANYAGQFFSTVIGFVFVPLYLKYMGAEAYGLVGFFVVLQIWFGLLDAGFSPLLNREVARARGKSHDFSEFRRMLRSVELVFVGSALVTLVGVGAFSGWISHSWFKVQTLDFREVSACVTLMGAMLGMRYFATLYRSGMGGMEDQVWLNGINIGVALAKALGSLAVLAWISPTPLAFFGFQLIVSIAEPLLLGGRLYATMPASKKPVGMRFYWEDLRPALPFGLSMAYTSLLWLGLSQVDKLLLSGILPLHEYGYFALVTALCSAVSLVASPIANALLPRLTYLHSRGEEQEMLRLYRNATQMIVVLMAPLSGVVALFGKELLYVWTGNSDAAQWAGPVLVWYMLGNGLATLLAYQYYLQYAMGEIRLNVYMNTVRTVLGAPVMIWAAYRYGALGTGMVWFLIQVICFVVWTPLIHHKLVPGLHRRWLWEDIAPVAACSAVGLLLVSAVPEGFLNAFSRPVLFIVLCSLGGIVLAMTAAGSLFLRGMVYRFAIKKLGLYGKSHA